VKLTVTVITKNEAAHIAAALQSVAWADETIVVDSGSSDGTVAIAQSLATRVDVRGWPGYSAQKDYAAGLASNDWILSLDADERVTPELGAEIRALLDGEPAARGYRIPRVTWYLGRWIRSTDWYPDYQLRLYDRRAGEWNGRPVHESIELRGTPGVLRHPLEHYAYRNISHHLATIDRYTTLAAEQWMVEGRRTNLLAACLHADLAFLRNYVLRRGFADGAAGFLVSILNSYYVLLKFAKLWELQHAAGVRQVEGLADVSGRSPSAPGSGAISESARRARVDHAKPPV
jgi:glycosyltransferase involved in cell wall biosynthesis